MSAGAQVSYTDLYTRWERGNWRAMEIDFTEDRRQWHEVMTEQQRRAALWQYSMFFVGEDAVADDLAPFIAAAPLEEQKYFLATQQVDEARHAIFFKRFMEEVVRRGDGTIAGGLDAVEPQLTWGFRKTFALLDEITGALRTDQSRVALARAVTMYHVVVEALLAQPGQHFISDYLERSELLPGFRAGMKLVALDEQRHIGFGVKLLHDLAQEDPAVPDAVADLLRRATSLSLAVFIPPGWDRSYTECFGFTLEEIYTEGARSLEAKLRSAGLPLESLPGPPIFPLDLDARGRAEYGLAMLRAGFLGPGTARRRAIRRRWSCCSRRSRARSTTGRRRPGRSPCSGSSPTPSRGTCAWTTARRRRRPDGPSRWMSRSAAATRTGSTSSPAGSIRAGRWSPGSSARTARRARCGALADCSDERVEALARVRASAVYGPLAAHGTRVSKSSVFISSRLSTYASGSLSSSTATAHSPSRRNTVSPVNRWRFHRNAVAPGVWPGVGMISKSPPSTVRSENVRAPGTWSASRSWTRAGRRR